MMHKGSQKKPDDTWGQGKIRLNNTCVFVLFQLDRFIPISKLKYYFAVDTVYVGKKLGLLVFPYMHEVSLFTPAKYEFFCQACHFAQVEVIL